MDEENGDLKSSFVRQRRNLIGVSLALVFYQSTGLVIRKLNIFGNELVVTDPSLASVVLWVAWLYFSIRYYQYFRDLPDKGIKGAYLSKLHELMKIAAFNEFKRLARDELEDMPAGAQLDFKEGSVDSYLALPTVWQYKVTAYVSFSTPEGRTTRKFTDREVSVHDRPLRGAKLGAAIHACVNTRFLTEYFLPFGVACVPVVLAVMRVARGSA